MSDKILLVEDEELIGEMVKLNLEQDGYAVEWVKDGALVLDSVKKRPVDLVVLDVMLPNKNGFQIAKELRRNEIGTPILMLTARAEINDKVKGLDNGADDYLIKPFEMDEFLARVRALIRRSQTAIELPSSRMVKIGGFEINLETKVANSNEGRVNLSDKENLLVELFLKNPGKTLSRADILDEVWGMDSTPSERTVDNFIVKLRKLFEKDPDNPEHILTVRSHGYCFKP